MARTSSTHLRRARPSWSLRTSLRPRGAGAVAAAATVGALALSDGGPSVEASLAVSYTVVLVVLAWIDLRQRVLPNCIVLPAILFGLASAVVGAEPGLGAALLGGLFAAAPFVLLFLMAPPGAIGAGDVKMAALVGLIAGVPSVFGALLIATVTASVVAGILRARRGAGRSHPMPYGPFLALGGLATLL